MRAKQGLPRSFSPPPPPPTTKKKRKQRRFCATMKKRNIAVSGCAKNDNSPKMAASGGKDILAASPPTISRDNILSEYPLHWHVWHKDSSSLEEELALNKHDKELLDPRGRTPLQLAVSLGYLNCVKCLLRGGCDANAINRDGWNVSHEAISTGNPEILSLVLQHRDFQRGSQRLAGIPELLDELSATADSYVEMKWEFTSWVPFMSRMCPSDTYKIYKCGANVRADTTLIGFDQNDWQRGNRSYVFKGGADGGEFLEIDHDKKRYFRETLRIRHSKMQMMKMILWISEKKNHMLPQALS
ncbi:ankyrin repeat domain-containing protein 13B-like isoform X2 [Oculina patagonica]